MVLNLCQNLQVALALQHPPFMARLVLGANQAMRTTAAKRSEIEVAATVADTMLQMTAFGLSGAVSPGRTCWIGEKAVEFAAMTT